MAQQLRERNNQIKRDFINTYVHKGSKVLDVGCGQGGDLHKWRYLQVKLTGVDPNSWAIEEAKRRSRGTYGTFLVGDIVSAPRELYDVICYNFSLQYQPLELISEITKRLVNGGILIGVVTNSDKIFLPNEDGIQVKRVSDCSISVFIPDTPYYANGPVEEPILDRETLIKEADGQGLKLLLWESFSIYAKFVFRYQE